MKKKKVLTLLVSIFFITTTITPSLVCASDGSNDEIMGGIAEIGELKIKEINENVFVVEDRESNEKSTISFSPDFTKAEIVNSDKTIDRLIKKDGKIYLNNEVIGEIVIEKEEEKRPLLKATSYKYVTTFKTKMSIQKTSASIGIGLAGLVGGPIGAFSTVAGIVSGLKSLTTQKEVYIKIKQYYNAGLREIKNDYFFYKKSNYTSLIKTYSHKYRPYG